MQGVQGVANSRDRLFDAGRSDQRCGVRWPADSRLAPNPPVRPSAGHPLGRWSMTPVQLELALTLPGEYLAHCIAHGWACVDGMHFLRRPRQ